MSLSTFQWHQRYRQQAEWTNEIRQHIYSKLAIGPSTKILDIGCGTGALEKELRTEFSILPYGIDINLENLRFAQGYSPDSFYSCADSLLLPFRSHTFDICLCHYVLLWINDPQKAVYEMARVTKSRGYVIAMAEPDYGGRIDYPSELSRMGVLQSEALKNQGADPVIGRKLKSLFYQAGLSDIETGVLGGQWSGPVTDHAIQLEWQVLVSDLGDNKEFIERSGQWKDIDQKARVTGQRILYVPTFYAWGKVSL